MLFKNKYSLLFIALIGCVNVSYASEENTETSASNNRVEFGGAIRMRFDYDPDEDIRKLSFDTAIANVDFYLDQLSGHYEHRFLGGAYPYDYTDQVGDVNFTKYAYLGYQVNDHNSVQVGLNQVPIGFQPYYTSTVIESIAYIAGIEDLYRLGLKYEFKNDQHNFLMGYYADNSWKGKGTSNGAYYSNVIIPADEGLEGGTHFEEKDALALQYNYTTEFNQWNTNLGLSAYYSNLESKVKEEGKGHRNIYALHYGIDKENLSLKLITLYNEIDTGFDQTTFGAYDGTFNVANKGMIYSADLNYKIPQFNVRDINDFNVYLHYSRYDKSKKSFLDSDEFVLGSAFTYKKNLYIAAEWLFGKNNPYIGASGYSNSLAAGGTNQWENQINVNLGYYF